MNKKILIIEDNPLQGLALKDLLSRFDYLPILFTSLKEDFDINEVVESHTPALAIIDITIHTKMDGIEVANYLKRGFNIPVIYITGHVHEEIMHEARKTEPYCIISKPWDDSKVVEMVASALKDNTSNKQGEP